MEDRTSTKENIDNTVVVLKNRLEIEKGRYISLEEELKRCGLVISSLETTIAAITNPSNVLQDANTGSLSIKKTDFEYDDNSSWKEKIIAFLKFKNKAVTTHEIVDEFEKHDILYAKKQIANLVSGAMSFLVKDGIVKAYKPKKMKGAYYANPSWFINETELKEEYLPEIKNNLFWG